MSAPEGRPDARYEGANRTRPTMLVDLSSIIYRAFHAVPPTVRSPEGEPVNGAYGFLNMLARLVADHRPRALACATDDDWRPQWRVDLIDTYKAHRVADDEEAVDPVAPQEAILCELLRSAGIAVVGAEGYEAEDVIGTLAARITGPVAVVSGDRDLFQLVRDPDVYVLYPVRGVSELARIDEAEIVRRYGIPGRAYADFAVLRGDPSDGLPGVRGVGEKTAAALIAKHGSIEAVMAAALADPTGPLGKVAGALDYVERAVEVVRIPTDAPVPDADLTVRPPADAEALRARADRYGLGGAMERLIAALTETSAG